MKFAIDRKADTPIFEQIAEQVRRGVAAGQFAKGEPLPSVRSMAQDLGVNPMTVSKAYGILTREVLIGAKPAIAGRRSRCRATASANCASSEEGGSVLVGNRHAFAFAPFWGCKWT